MIKNLKEKIGQIVSNQRTRKYLLFTIFKYIEYGITAFSFFYFANKVGPEKYGYATSGLLVVTYSAFAVLGVNQVLVKWYALSKDEIGQINIIKYNIFYNVLFGILLLISISFILVNKSYNIQVGLIVGLKLLQECSVNINRVEQKIFNINVIYLSFGIPLLLGTVLYVNDTESFFNIWSYCLIISAIVGGMTIMSHLNIINKFQEFKIWCFKNIKRLIIDGVKFATMGAILPLYLSIDRILLINYSDLSEETLGNYQLADNISAVITLGFNAILFIITPPLLTKLHKGEIKPSYFFRLSYKIFIGILIVSLLTGSIGSLFIQRLFPEYDNITYPLLMYIINRSLFIGFFVYSNICIVASKETLYIKLAYACFSLVVIGYSIALLAVTNTESLIYIFPQILLGAILLLHGVYYWFIVRKNSFFRTSI